MMGAIDAALWAAALGAFLFTLRRDPIRVPTAFGIIKSNVIVVAPSLLLMLTAAAFLSPLVPVELVGKWIGPSSGMTGVMIASLLGGLIPGGPIISFPLLVTLSMAGAGTAQIIALLAAWSVVAIHRLVAFEIPLMGASFTWRRLLASAPLPPIAGMVALALLN